MKNNMMIMFIFGFAFVSCGGGGASSKKSEVLSVAVEAPAEITALHSHTIYQVLVSSTDGTRVFVSPSVPLLNSEDNGREYYVLEIDTTIPNEEVLVAFRYVSEESSMSENPVVLSEAAEEVVWVKNLSVRFDAVQFNSDGLDADEDGMSNLDEVVLGLNPQDEDSDGDGVSDSEDAFPNLNGEL